MNIILCNEGIYKYVEDYILSIINLLRANLLLFNYNIDLTYSSNNNYIFIQNVNNNFFIENSNKTNLFLINTEQLSVDNSRITINDYPGNLIIIDYSLANLKYYNEKFTKFFLPYQINYNEIFNIYKSNNICLIDSGVDKSFNRLNIVNLLNERNVDVDIISGFGKERDITLFKYKIILNIAYISGTYRIFESFRCDRCIYNKMIVISDIKEDIENYYLSKYMIFVNYNEIVDKVVDVLNNYETYYNKLFSEFDFKEIEADLANLSKPLLENIF
uniref:Uncharacterized protein n=1 Tax=viral metagenome TaxID=1070528 RepID=A0A6C0JF06_9ZZZZ